MTNLPQTEYYWFYTQNRNQEYYKTSKKTPTLIIFLQVRKQTRSGFLKTGNNLEVYLSPLFFFTKTKHCCTIYAQDLTPGNLYLFTALVSTATNLLFASLNFGYFVFRFHMWDHSIFLSFLWHNFIPPPFKNRFSSPLFFEIQF